MKLFQNPTSLYRRLDVVTPKLGKFHGGGLIHLPFLRSRLEDVLYLPISLLLPLKGRDDSRGLRAYDRRRWVFKSVWLLIDQSTLDYLVLCQRYKSCAVFKSLGVPIDTGRCGQRILQVDTNSSSLGKFLNHSQI